MHSRAFFRKLTGDCRVKATDKSTIAAASIAIRGRGTDGGTPPCMAVDRIREYPRTTHDSWVQ
ncbi:hypothetical protein GCM10007170_32060 [Arthrobacter liuii]|uniref:Uncharacterized protein n=1 Tax=Arthrobacter liuii TaxID=1476996 RepID=A0ABQ2AY59_9MICC|nr:hypothetical protein GCM10007170_32060 [Arthrobacter liuii]